MDNNKKEKFFSDFKDFVIEYAKTHNEQEFEIVVKAFIDEKLGPNGEYHGEMKKYLTAMIKCTEKVNEEKKTELLDYVNKKCEEYKQKKMVEKDDSGLDVMVGGAIDTQQPTIIQSDDGQTFVDVSRAPVYDPYISPSIINVEGQADDISKSPTIEMSVDSIAPANNPDAIAPDQPTLNPDVPTVNPVVINSNTKQDTVRNKIRRVVDRIKSKGIKKGHILVGVALTAVLLAGGAMAANALNDNNQDILAGTQTEAPAEVEETTLAGNEMANNETTVVENANNQVTNANETVQYDAVSYDSYTTCINYNQDIIKRAVSENGGEYTAEHDKVAQDISVVSLMDSVREGTSVCDQTLVEGLNNDGYVAPKNVAGNIIEKGALPISYMLVNHPNEIDLSKMVLGTTDKEVLSGLQTKYNAVINAKTEDECKRALWDLCQYEENNICKDGLTHIIGNEVVGTVIPEKLVQLEQEKGWDLIKPVQSEASYTAEVTSEGVFSVQDDTVYEIKMIDDKGNVANSTTTGLFASDIKQMEEIVKTYGQNGCAYEGHGAFSSVSSNPNMSAEFLNTANEMGLQTYKSMQK